MLVTGSTSCVLKEPDDVKGKPTVAVRAVFIQI